jgi:hypothetical protein
LTPNGDRSPQSDCRRKNSGTPDIVRVLRRAPDGKHFLSRGDASGPTLRGTPTSVGPFEVVVQSGHSLDSNGCSVPALPQAERVMPPIPVPLLTSELVASGDAVRVSANVLSVAHWVGIAGGELYASTSRVDWASSADVPSRRETLSAVRRPSPAAGHRPGFCAEDPDRAQGRVRTARSAPGGSRRFTPRRFTPPKGAQLVPDGRKWRGSALSTQSRNVRFSP